jgi:hypothetical protein
MNAMCPDDLNSRLPASSGESGAPEVAKNSAYEPARPPTALIDGEANRLISSCGLRRDNPDLSC